MIDALSGRHVWADRFDRQWRDIFALQDEIVKNVVVELQVELAEGNTARLASRGTDSLEAWLYRLEASGEFYKFTREGMIRARELYEAAQKADPNWTATTLAAWGVSLEDNDLINLEFGNNKSDESATNKNDPVSGAAEESGEETTWSRMRSSVCAGGGITGILLIVGAVLFMVLSRRSA